jgi:hypothetical protein
MTSYCGFNNESEDILDEGLLLLFVLSVHRHTLCLGTRTVCTQYFFVCSLQCVKNALRTNVISGL